MGPQGSWAGRFGARALCGCIALAAVALAGPARGEAPAALSPTAGREARELFADPGWSSPLDGGFSFDSADVAGRSLRVRLARRSPDGARTEVATLVLSPRDPALPGALHSASFAIEVQAPGPLDGRAVLHLAAAVASVVRHDDGSFYASRAAAVEPAGPAPRPGPAAAAPAPRLALDIPVPPRPPTPLWEPDEGDTSAAAALLLLAGFLAWFFVRRLRGPPATLATNFVSAHVLIGSLQLTLFFYWALYWPGVRDHWPHILSTLGYALGLDALLSLWTRHRVVASLAILPMVFSTHLFVWFAGADFWLYYAIMTIALFSKVFLQRGGRHIFNPSALGIALVAVCCYAAPSRFGFVDISHRLASPASMFELMLCLALVAQLRARIVLVSVGILLATGAIQAVHGQLGGDFRLISVYWPPVFLAVVLLSTDPATIARTPGGRILYGLTYGVIITAVAAGLTGSGRNDFFAKVMPIPICNYLVPWFDRQAALFGSRVGGWLAPTRNRVHVALWLLLALVPWWMDHDKAQSFDTALYSRDPSELVARVDGQVTCEHNPAFCEPFPIATELKLLLATRRP